MESNWRWNVSTYGLSNTEVQLIAPILSGPWAGFLLLDNGPGTYAEIATTPLPGELPVHVAFDTSFTTPGFPWTYDVAPDS